MLSLNQVTFCDGAVQFVIANNAATVALLVALHSWRGTAQQDWTGGQMMAIPHMSYRNDARFNGHAMGELDFVALLEQPALG